MFACTTLVCFLAFMGTDEKWPPPGPAWETDPQTAFQRARDERKGLLVYVATEGYPPCIAMAREVWPAPELVQSSGDVILLAVHYSRQPDSSRMMDLLPSGFQGDEWRIRMNVMGYPKLRYMDGWGRPLTELEGWENARSLEDVTYALKTIPAAMSKVRRPSPGELSYEVARIVPKRDREGLSSPDHAVRERIWSATLQERRTTQQLAVIFEEESDPIVRLVILGMLLEKDSKKLERDRYVRRVVDAAAWGDNDFVRASAIELAARIGGDDSSVLLTEVIEAVVEDRSGWLNPNNMLCAATEAASELADPEMLGTLVRVLEATTDKNLAHRNALYAVRAIGQSGKKKREVSRILEQYDR